MSSSPTMPLLRRTSESVRIRGRIKVLMKHLLKRQARGARQFCLRCLGLAFCDRAHFTMPRKSHPKSLTNPETMDCLKLDTSPKITWLGGLSPDHERNLKQGKCR